MESYKHTSSETSHEDTIGSGEHVYKVLKKDRGQEILNAFTSEEQEEIRQKQQLLSSLAYFIGKDFQIPVELNEAGEGWHWDFAENVIRIDPVDLLQKSMDYLRFVISHEAGHVRITRADSIPLKEWNQPGFAFMMNAIEDPRENNFVAESYPKFREQMQLAYNEDLGIEVDATQKAAQKLGFHPRFKQAGFEYIRQWFRESQGEPVELSPDLPDDVKRVVEQTLEAARDSWLRYPSREEADNSEDIIRQYAKLSYEINRDEVWPQFKTLIEADIQDQKLQEELKKLQKKDQGSEGEAEEGENDLPQALKDMLTPEEQKELEEKIKEAVEKANEVKNESSDDSEGGESNNEEGKETSEPAVIDLKTLSENLKQKINDYIDSLPEDVKKELQEKAEAAIKEFEKELVDEMKGKLSEDPNQKAERKALEGKEKTEPIKGATESNQESSPIPVQPESPEQRDFKAKMREALESNENVYEQYRREMLPLIDKLESDLREIFIDRKSTAWKSGFQRGKRIDIKKRIQEKVKDVSAMESKAWQKRDMPSEKDYAISILVDLSGSMSEDGKIQETFKAVIILTEVLNRLSINLEILGFNDRIYDYQTFGQDMSKQIRENMGGMLEEVYDGSDGGKAHYNDDGWALMQASERLAKQKADNKFLIALSDGQPMESPLHPRRQYELGAMIKKILSDSDVHLVGLGVGQGTEHVARYYPNSIANIQVEQMAEKLAGLIKEVIANYGSF